MAAPHSQMGSHGADGAQHGPERPYFGDGMGSVETPHDAAPRQICIAHVQLPSSKVAAAL